MFVKKKTAEEFMRELMPIFESLRQRESLPCSYPLAMGPSRQTNTFWVNCHKKKIIIIIVIVYIYIFALEHLFLLLFIFFKFFHVISVVSRSVAYPYNICKSVHRVLCYIELITKNISYAKIKLINKITIHLLQDFQ